MRILYHHRTLSEDGQAVHIRALQQAFEEEGHEVHEVSLVKHGEDSAQAQEKGNEGRGRWGWVTRLPRFARELAEYGYNGIARSRLVGAAARIEPDFIYERYAFGNAAGLLAAKRLGVPLVLEVNSPMVEELSKTRGLSFPGLARKMENAIFCGADRVCVVSQVLGGMLGELGVESERLLVTPNGVDLERYPRDEDGRRRSAARERLGLAGAGPILGFVGYYRDWHRLDLVVDALARPELAEARLVLVGFGPAEESLRARASELGVSERLHFPGRFPHPEIPALLPAFDLALIPAINPYASPLKLHEYMAAELAVLAPDQANLREVVTHGENGWLVTPGDGEALARALAELVGDPALRRGLGAAARRTIVEREMTWRGNAKRVVRAVEAL